MQQHFSRECSDEDELEIKGYPPLISKEKAIEIARKKSFSRKERGMIGSVSLLYKPYLLYYYKAIVRHRKYRDKPSEEIGIYIAIDMITGVGFEFDTLEPITVIRVRKTNVITPLIDENKAFNEVIKLVLKLKAKVYRYGLEIIEENIDRLGILYKPIWIIRFIDQGKEKYVGIDALKGTRI